MQEKPEIRCGHCNRLLGRGTARDIEIKCPRCGAYTIVRAGSPSAEPRDGQRSRDHADPQKDLGD